MKNRFRPLIIAAVALVAILGVGVLIHLLSASRNVVRYTTRPVSYADITSMVTETGTVNPVNVVSVGTEVSGTIQTLGVDYNSIVKTGEILATLDPTNFQAAVDLAEAQVHSAVVNVGKSKAELDLANVTIQRDDPLLKKGYITQDQMDTDQEAQVSAQQDYLASQAAVVVADAELHQATYSLQQAVIRSPIDGIVMARNVTVGETVAASFQTPTLFTLATNLTDMQVDTSVDEADIGSVREGQTSEITVTAFPNTVFPGTVAQVRVNPTVVQNVVTYDAVIAIHDSSGSLLPGMTAQVNIVVGKRTHVLAVPIAAVLYRPLGARGGPPGPGAAAVSAGMIQSAGGSQQNPNASGAAVAGAPGSRVLVWELKDNRPVPMRVVIGMSDGQNIEITGGNLHEDDPLIIAQRRGGPGETRSANGQQNRQGQGNGGLYMRPPG